MNDEMAQKERSNIKCYTSAFRYIYIYIYIILLQQVHWGYDEHYSML